MDGITWEPVISLGFGIVGAGITTFGLIQRYREKPDEVAEVKIVAKISNTKEPHGFGHAVFEFPTPADGVKPELRLGDWVIEFAEYTGQTLTAPLQ